MDDFKVILEAAVLLATAFMSYYIIFTLLEKVLVT